MSYHSDLDIIGETPNLANAQAYAQRYAIATAPDTHIARPVPDLNGTLTFREAFAAAAEVNQARPTYSTTASQRQTDRQERREAGM